MQSTQHFVKATTPALALALMLASCGGGGMASTPAPAPAPSPSPSPTPSNASLETLVATQSFTNIAATHTAQFDLSSSNTNSGSSAKAPLTITYNASGGTYTISAGGRSQIYSSADTTSSSKGIAVFSKSGADSTDRLTLWAPSFGGNGPRYVGRGLWQRNRVSGSIQDTTLDMFTYGLETKPSAMIRTGTAAFLADVFGVTTKPGTQPRSFQGSGNFNVDFLTGVFNSVVPVTESELVSGAGVSGGGIEVALAGVLSASDGTFSGYAAYGGGSSRSQGTVDGRFYGPAANELGAIFTTAGADGSSTTGGLLGSKSSNPISANLALTNLAVDELFYTSNSWVELVNSGQASALGSGNGQLTIKTDGSVSFSGPRSDMAFGSIAASDQIAASAANFTTYRKSLNGFTVTADFYKPGSANSEIVLTYASFVHFNELFEGLNRADQYNIYTVYGIPTNTGIVYARKGTASYSGVAHGTGIDAANNVAYKVTGTSRFDADFSAATLTGALALSGQSASSSHDFGTLNFATSIVNGYPVTADLTKSGTIWGTISARFFGPVAQEIGATFGFAVPAGQPGGGIAVTGAAVAK